MLSLSPIRAAIATVRQRIFRINAEDSLPHVVTHQRVYIVPTKRGLAFIAALLLMLVASVNYALSLGYALSFILTGLFAATLLHTYRNLAGVEVASINANNTFAGEKMSFFVSLTNRLDENRHGIRVSTDDDIRLMTHIEPSDKAQVLLAVPTQTRGIRQLGRITIQSDWPLGLWTCWTYLHVPAEGVVYPVPEENAPALPVSEISVDTGKKAVGFHGEVSDLRAYRPGDSPGTIAWKSAAKGFGMHVRTFDESFAPEDILLHLNETGHSSLEDQLSRLCAWTVEAHSVQAKYGLQLPGQSIASNQGDIHFKKALETLALYGIRR